MSLCIGTKVTLVKSHYLMDGEAYLIAGKYANNKLLKALANASSSLDLVDLLSGHTVVMPGDPGVIVDTAYKRGAPVFVVKFNEDIHVQVGGGLLAE